MSVSVKTFYRGACPLSLATPLYTHSTAANGTGILAFIEAQNRAYTPSTLTVYVVPSGGTDGDSNVMIDGEAGKLRARGAGKWKGWRVLVDGDMIYAVATVGPVALSISGQTIL